MSPLLSLANGKVCCPNTGRYVTGEQITIQSNFRLQEKSMWWRCSVCNRWHVINVESDETPAKIVAQQAKGSVA